MAQRGGSSGPGRLEALLGAGTTAGLTDGQLVERFAARPSVESAEAAFEALVTRHGPMVRGVCRQVLRDEADADDTFQAVFLVLARRAGSIRDPDLLAPWLHGVALRTARLTRRRRRSMGSLTAEPAAAPEECAVERREAAEVLHEEVGRLPEPQRRAVALCHLEGLTHEEAGRRLGVPASTVGVRLLRARNRLRDRLTRRGFGPGASAFPPTSAIGVTSPRAWAALSHLRGATAGEVPVGVASLATGALHTMTPLKMTAATLLLTIGLAATGAWSLARTPAHPAGPAPAAAAPPVLAAVPAEDPGLAEFRKVYRLDPAQVVKRIPPPFAAWRLADAEARFPFIKENRERRGHLNTLIYRERGGVLKNPSMSFGSPMARGQWLVNLLEGVAGFPAQDVEGPKDLLETPIEADWVVAAEAPPERRVAELDAILHEECKLPIRLRLHEKEREVVVARGRFELKPVLAGVDAIQFYGATLTPNGGGGGGKGTVAECLTWLGRFVEPHRRIMDEVEARPAGPVSWSLNFRSPFTERMTQEDRGDEAVLRHVAEQTGLTFTVEVRKVPILTVERAE